MSDAKFQEEEREDVFFGRKLGGGGGGGGRVVYVGAGGALEYKKMLGLMLREAAPYGLDIYGSGWQDIPEFAGFWRGSLPEGELVSDVSTYSVASVAASSQRRHVMCHRSRFRTPPTRP